MDEGFLDKLKRQQSEEAFAKMEKGMARDELLSSMEPGPITDFAMMVGGGGKFTGPAKGLMKFFPKTPDEPEAINGLKKIYDAFKSMGMGERKEAYKLLKPKVAADRKRLNEIYRGDIANNPRASTTYTNTINKNDNDYRVLDDYLESLLKEGSKGMNYGGIASMPLKYDL